MAGNTADASYCLLLHCGLLKSQTVSMYKIHIESKKYCKPLSWKADQDQKRANKSFVRLSA